MTLIDCAEKWIQKFHKEEEVVSTKERDVQKESWLYGNLMLFHSIEFYLDTLWNEKRLDESVWNKSSKLYELVWNVSMKWIWNEYEMDMRWKWMGMKWA